MKLFDIYKKALLTGLKRVAAATQNTSMLSRGVIFDVTNENLTLTASSSDLSAKVVINQPNPDYCTEAGDFYHCFSTDRFLVPEDIVENIVSAFTGNIIDVIREGNMIILSDGHSKFSIRTMNIKDFPDIDFDSDSIVLVIKTDTFKDIIRRTKTMINLKENRPVLTGVNFKYESGTLTAFATDSYQLTKITNLVSFTKDNKIDDTRSFDVTVPLRALLAIEKQVFNHDEEITIYLDTTSAIFSTFTMTIKTPLLTGGYPVVDRLIPDRESCTTFFEIERSTLMSIIKRASLFKAPGSSVPIVKMVIDTDKVEFFASDEAIGTFREIVNLEIHGNPIDKVYFSTSALTNLLNGFDGEKVILYFRNNKSPLMIYETDNESMVEILCPTQFYE